MVIGREWDGNLYANLECIQFSLRLMHITARIIGRMAESKQSDFPFRDDTNLQLSLPK